MLFLWMHCFYNFRMPFAFLDSFVHIAFAMLDLFAYLVLGVRPRLERS